MKKAITCLYRSSWIAMLLIVIVSGCKKDAITSVRPTVVSTDPINNATNSGISSKISATFSLAMDPAMTQFTVKQGSTNVAGAVVSAGTLATFTPSAMLAPSTVYTATIAAGAKDLAGATLAENFVWSFTTGLIPDTTPPTVLSSDPANNATAVAFNHTVVATFSEAMDATSVTAATFTVKQGTVVVPGAVVYASSKATFTPTSPLDPAKVYTATITTGAKDVAGNAMAANFTFSFTTANAPDTTAPTVVSTDPLNSAIGVAQNKTVAVVFSEAMDPTSISASTFTFKQGTTVVPGLVAYSGTTATFKATSSLTAGTVYTAVISTGAKDLAGNALAAGTTFSFTTELLPVVNSTNPLNNATGVARNKVVSLTFSKAMDITTISASTFTLMQGTTPVAGTVFYSGSTATFTPSNLLAASTSYTATITTGAKDLAGNALAASTVISFTTGGSTSTLAVVNLNSAINYVILAKTAISNVSTSAINGDLGLSPAAESYITGLSLIDATGYATSSQVTGSVYAADQALPTPTNLTTAIGDMMTAYTDAAGRPTPDFSELGVGNIGGKTLIPGLYKWSTTVTLPSDVIISGGANDVWIFQIAGDLTQSNAVHVTLSGGAQAKNIFWQVAGTVTLGTTSHFEGIVLSQTAIILQTGASMNGRALAQSAVTLDGVALTKPL